MDFTYHHHLHHSVAKWIASILPLLQLFVHSFHLKCILLFCRRDFSYSFPFSPVIKAIQEALSLWYLSTNEFLAHKFGASIRGCRSILYLSSNPLPATSLFPSSSDLIFPCYLPWLSPVFNLPSFSLFTTTNLSSLPQSPTFCPPLIEPRLYVLPKRVSKYLSLHNMLFTIQLTPFLNQTFRWMVWYTIFLSPFFYSCSCPASD